MLKWKEKIQLQLKKRKSRWKESIIKENGENCSGLLKEGARVLQSKFPDDCYGKGGKEKKRREKKEADQNGSWTEWWHVEKRIIC